MAKAHGAGRFRARGHAGAAPAPGHRPPPVLDRLALDPEPGRRDLRRARRGADRRRASGEIVEFQEQKDAQAGRRRGALSRARPRPPAHRLRAPGRVLGGDARARASRRSRWSSTTGEALPDWREFDAVLAMGGPMGAGDDADHPWLAPERELVRDGGRGGTAVSRRLPRGAAAGGGARRARLRGRAAGGRPARGRAHRRGRERPAVRRARRAAVSLQWHGDTFDLPEGAVRLARSPAVANQAFRVGERAYGVQFHLEVTAEMAREWARSRPTATRSREHPRRARAGDEFIADVERRAGELHPPARALVRQLARPRRRAGVGRLRGVRFVQCALCHLDVERSPDSGR